MLLRLTTFRVSGRTAASTTAVDMFVPAGGSTSITAELLLMKNVPGFKSAPAVTWVSGVPFTKTISVRNAMGANVVGQPEGKPHTGGLRVHPRV